jgi:DNA polymerase-4
MRRILYLQAIHFHTAVQALLDPGLRGRPLIVAAGSYQRGKVVAVSPEAAAEGAARGMPWRQARRRCPDSVLIPYQRATYAPFVEQLGSIIARATPWVERLEGAEDEFFAGLGEGPLEEGCRLAHRIQEEIAAELALPVRLALASGKLPARAGADYGSVWVSGCG